jgi:hypothetical protein
VLRVSVAPKNRGDKTINSWGGEEIRNSTVVTDLNLIWPNSEKVKKIISILANTQQECSDDSYTFS